ncbi:hypothetical protein [Legionella clemsonensis]|uniref:Uncharacterized protein n=1 Tax=Legionella clemsonensis TaxID=1867846 RepID=A0A222P458_9GAMM|nr:hypothetical protein [Legionella clemsonensis]ASQ46607.1 hypothetical protein clem_10305 [Legionella clemsonensis]
MSRLLKSHKKIYNNYQEFEKTKNPQFLLKNIEEFERISSEENIPRILQKSTIPNLDTYSKILILVAQSYIDYAFITKEQFSLKEKEAQEYLSKAKKCYQFFINTVAKIPPFSLGELTSTNTEVIFYSHKIDFFKAKMRLSFVKNSMQGNYSAEKISSALKEIIETYDAFEQMLLQKYRHHSYGIFGINDALFTSIKEGRDEAENLLSAIKPAKRVLEEKSPSSSKPKHTVKRRRVKEKQKQEETTEIQESTETADFSNNFSPVIIDPPIVSPGELVSVAREEESGLSVLSTAAMSFFLPVKESHLPEKPQTPPPAPSKSLLSTFWTPPPNANSDSQQCWSKINDWSRHYFLSLNKNVSEQEKIALTLEKFAQTLLLAALELQQKSSSFGQQKINPALHLSVQIFHRCAQLSTKNSNPYINLRVLSKQYAELLASFVPHSSMRDIEEYEYLEHIQKNLRKLPSLIRTLNVNTEDLVNATFKVLADNCTPEDYQTVNTTCSETFDKATSSLKRDAEPSSRYN